MRVIRKFYVKCSVGSYLVKVGTGKSWWGSRKEAIPLEEREARLRARLGFDSTGRNPGSIEEAPSIIYPEFTPKGTE